MPWAALEEFWVQQYLMDYGHFFLHYIAYTRDGKNQLIPLTGLN